jgi:hypothetical protein
MRPTRRVPHGGGLLHIHDAQQNKFSGGPLLRDKNDTNEWTQHPHRSGAS